MFANTNKYLHNSLNSRLILKIRLNLKVWKDKFLKFFQPPPFSYLRIYIPLDKIPPVPRWQC